MINSYIVFAAILLSSITLIPNSLEASVPENNVTLEKTVVKIFDYRTAYFDGSQPIVFSGKLATPDGTRIGNSEILIKGDHACTDDGIIAKGMTDKYGKFWIYTMPKQWNPETNLLKIHAEFLGDENYLPAKSNQKIIVIYPTHTPEC